jgi:hypothetical protein
MALVLEDPLFRDVKPGLRGVLAQRLSVDGPIG